MLKTIIGVAAGIILAALILLSGWMGYVEYIDYKRKKVLEEVSLSHRKQLLALSAIDSEYVNKDEKVRNCLKSAVKHHNEPLKLSSIVRSTESFIALNYEVLDERFHAQCKTGYKSDDVVSFNVL